MNGWIKLFRSGKKEVGTDAAVANKQASWSCGNLHDMTGASLSHDGWHIAISGLGKYWQSDDYEVAVGESEPTITKRRLERFITMSDKVISVLQTEHSVMLRVIDPEYNPTDILVAETTIPIPWNAIGKWLVIEIDIKKKKIKWYFNEGRI